ncbi:MAG: hypothetical protein ACUVRG_08260, partial [Ignavibacterium sp.]|uniref:hypothetical protein n=1 Tax=Ignavibacterium sp. TaxID=2651167 RepID=UPI00404B4C03
KMGKKRGKVRVKTKTKRISLEHTSFKLVYHKISNYISFESVNVSLYRNKNNTEKIHLRKHIYEDDIQKGSSILMNTSLLPTSRFLRLSG